MERFSANDEILIKRDCFSIVDLFYKKQGRKRPLDTPKRMIERREREGKKGKRRDIEREGEIREKERESERERE